MYLLGLDIGSSSIKAALVNAKTKQTISSAKAPKDEMTMIAHQSGWAEQAPEMWWEHLCTAIQMVLAEAKINPSQIIGIGIAYQMHGLVCVDKDHLVLRPAIIWCDSRAVPYGNTAFERIGQSSCLEHHLNSPGNFTAAKLAWVKENEPELYAQIHKIMLPGDYIAMKLSGEIGTTATGLSEGILWDFKNNGTSKIILDQFGFAADLIPEIKENGKQQGTVSAAAAKATGLAVGIPIFYRAGDQPNNALALNVLEPGEIAATGGTSGVVYGVTDRINFDPKSRVNSFIHVNHTKQEPRIGILLCINGCGIQYAWARRLMADAEMEYQEIEDRMKKIPVGADGVSILPFGNGAERVLSNQQIDSSIHGLDFNRHDKDHLFRAAIEGIAFAFAYGVGIMKECGLEISKMKVGNDNLFQSKVFSSTLATVLDCQIDVIETNGAAGAALAAGVGAGLYLDFSVATAVQTTVVEYAPDEEASEYLAAYSRWKKILDQQLNKDS